VLPRFDADAATAVLREAKRRGLSTSVDVCWDREGRWMELLRPCLPWVDTMMPSEEEAQQLTARMEPAEMAQVFLDAGARSAVIKLGEQGCHYADRETTIRVPAYDVEVRDTTGAGDCFIAGFIHARLAGKDPEAALRFGNACGARSVEAVGGVTGLAPAAEIEAWAANRRARPW
jgi:sugar/nucleoside kinase (ribokinase family)